MIEKDGLGEYWQYLDTDYLNYSRSGKPKDKKDKKKKPSSDPPPDPDNGPDDGPGDGPGDPNS